MFKTSIKISVGNWIATRRLIPAALFCLAGLALSDLFPCGHGLLATAIVLPAVLMLLALLRPRLAFVCLLFFALGWLRGLSVWSPSLAPTHWLFLRPSGSMAFEAKVSGPVSSGDGAVRSVVELTAVRLETGWRDLSGRLLLHMPADTVPPETGETIRFFGHVKVPASYRNPGSFDYVTFLQRRGISGVVNLGDPHLIKTIVPAGPWSQRAILDRARQHAVEKLQQVIDATHLGWIETVLANWRCHLDQETFAIFQRSGQAHLLSISGLHIMFLFLLVMVPLRRMLSFSARLVVLGRHEHIAAGVAAAVAVGYALFAGGDYPALRGALFVVAGLAILWTGRQRHLLITLIAAAFLILINAPSALWEASFQLSFAAIAGIAAILPLMQRLPMTGWLRSVASALLTTLGATLATLPIVLHHFGEWSGMALVVAPLVIPIFGFLIFPLLVILLALSCVHLAWAHSFYGIIRPPLDLFLNTLRWFALHGDPITLWWRPNGHSAWLLMLGIVIIWFGLIRIKTLKLKCGVIVGGFIFTIFIYLVATHRPSGFTATFLDVGQGDGIILEDHLGGVVMVDAGPVFGTSGAPGSMPFNLGDRAILPYLQSRGVRHIDLMILSHPHPDHYGGLAAVAARVPIQEVWANGDSLRAPELVSLWDAMKRRGTRIREVGQNETQRVGATELRVLWPPTRAPLPEGVNDRSLVVAARYQEASMLLTGDIERPAEQALIGNAALPAQVLKAPHHGSHTSNSSDWLEKIRPQFVVISCGLDNRFGFPHAEVLQRYEQLGVKIFRTDLDGAIRLVTKGEGWSVVTALGRDPPSREFSSGGSVF